MGKTKYARVQCPSWARRAWRKALRARLIEAGWTRAFVDAEIDEVMAVGTWDPDMIDRVQDVALGVAGVSVTLEEGD